MRKIRYSSIPARVTIVAAILLAVVSTVFLLRNRDDRSGLYACFAQTSLKERCISDYVEKIARSRGIEKGLDALADAYQGDPNFADTCHGVTHLLGEIAYRDFENNSSISLSEKTSYCGFGFYHGFVEALMAEKGELSEAERFCEYVDETLKKRISGISYACYHGIGHGVVDGSDVRNWGNEDKFIQKGLDLCAKFTDTDQHRERCASGVFNSLAIAYVTPKYRIVGDPKNPYAACKKQKMPYEQKACHDQMNGYITLTTDNFKEALQRALTAMPQYMSVAVASVSASVAKDALTTQGDLAPYLKDCVIVPEKVRRYCAIGFASGLIEMGKPGQEYVRAVTTCSKADDLVSPCLFGVTQAVKDRFPQDVQVRYCKMVRDSVSPKEGDICDAGLKEKT